MRASPSHIQCGFSLTVSIPDEALSDGEEWLKFLPAFGKWLEGLSQQSVYKHLLGAYNFAQSDSEGLVSDLSSKEIESEITTIDDSDEDQ